MRIMKKNSAARLFLPFEAEVPDNEAVLCVQLAGRTKAVQLFSGQGRRHPACAEEDIRLRFFKGIVLPGRACPAVFSAYLPVLFSILNGSCTGFHKGGWQHEDNMLLVVFLVRTGLSEAGCRFFRPGWWHTVEKTREIIGKPP